MKKISYILLFAFSFLINILFVFAAPSHYISVSRDKIEVGQSVTATVTVKNVAAWNIRVNGTGNTNGCSTSSADATSNGKNTTKTFKVTCSANSTGVIKISYSGDATSEDGANTGLSGSKTVTVVAARPKSSNNYLKSLSITDGTISPDFDKNTLEYTATLEAGTEKVTINAEKEDGYASLSGTGEKDVVEGENKFEVVVTSETGQSRTYTLLITVKEFDPIIVKYNGKEYTVVRKIADLEKPYGFEETTITIGEDTIPAYYNETTKKTLVVLKDEDGKTYLFEYIDGKYEKYIELSFEQIVININKMNKSLLPKGYKKFNLTFNGEKLEVYKYKKSSNFALVYATDLKTGDKALYQIDLKNKTVQLYNNELIDALNETNTNSIIIFAALGGVILLLFLLLFLSRKKRKKVLNKFKNEKIEKVKKDAIKESKDESVDNKIPEKHETEELIIEDKKRKKSKK